MVIRLLIILSFFYASWSFSQCAPGDNLQEIVVDSVSVDNMGNVNICWQGSPDPHIAYYTIFMVNPNTSANDSIGFVPVPGDICYTIPYGNAENNSDTRSNQYGIVAVDTCDNPSPLGGNYHNTIFLEHTTNICDATIALRWNAYDDFNTGPNVTYQIFASENGGNFMLDGTTNDVSYTFTNVNGPFTYRFFVRAVENNGAGPYSSSSNIITVNANFLQEPAFNYLFTGTVINNSQIDLSFYVDTTADITTYRIQRSANNGTSFVTIDSIDFSSGMNPLVEYSDLNVDADQLSYTYRIVPVNECGDEKEASNDGKTILLSVTPNEANFSNALTWTTYEDWLGGVLTYNIYRSIGGNWQLIHTQNGTEDAIYLDDLTDIITGDGTFCYRIEAIEQDTVHVGTLPPAAESSSNIYCTVYQPVIHIPSAFNPSSSLNPVFRPSLIYSDTENYQFSVYNSSGQLIFETTDINDAWDGSYQNTGSTKQLGVYVYSIQYQSADGETYSKKGRITLVN